MSKNKDPYLLKDLASREKAAKAMGGEDKIRRQHDKGRLTARERIDLLLFSALLNNCWKSTRMTIGLLC